MFARVSWAIGDQVGLAFAQPFDVQLLACSRPEVATSNWEAPDYLKGKTPPQADPWGRLSVSELQQRARGLPQALKSLVVPRHSLRSSILEDPAVRLGVAHR